MKMNEAKDLFKEYMTTTSSGMLVIDRHDYNLIIERIFREHIKEVREAKKGDDMFKQWFSEDD